MNANIQVLRIKQWWCCSSGFENKRKWVFFPQRKRRI